MYYDRRSNSWDRSACSRAGNTDRCVKMDCHLPRSTHYTLLGYFKEPSYDGWIDTLTHHQGDCLWTDAEYAAMAGLSRTAWPQKCMASIYTTRNDQVVYYDLRPMQYGAVTIGLYVDERCTQDYSGPLTAQEVLMGMVCGGYIDGGDGHNWNCGGSGTSSSSSSTTSTSSSSNSSSPYSLQNHLQALNSALDAVKQCQPCRAYDLTSVVAGRGYRPNLDRRHPGRDRYNSDQNYPAFLCNFDYYLYSGGSGSRYYYGGYGGGGGYGYSGSSNNQASDHADYATLNQVGFAFGSIRKGSGVPVLL
jgi:hypothetical protein